MSRTIFYGAAFAAFVSASILTLAAITIPRWVSYTYETSSGPITQTYGLSYSCRTGPGSTPTTCHPFPTTHDCADSPHFCTLWHSTNYLMNLALSIELLTSLSFLFILFGGVGYRKKGWGYLVGLLGSTVTCQLVAMSLVSYVYENDERFFVGWRLDVCWVICVVSWGVVAVVAGLVGLVGWVLPEEEREGGYERLQ
ncbi:uncharacterized protein DFL_009448 [Arthrobotrys flagrans]|uniref:MARVEL domain-containing protein n=1 Tax=Arthrobotrys flagrans TaxID=97331 RepID=A0A436ZRQ0_ARTFL|nr:hypothetical protein DFL_009448 [Arthrobotrys flagrans]